MINTGMTTRGRCLLAAGVAAAGCAVVLDERDMLRVAVFVFALPLLATLVARWARTRLRCTRSLRPHRVAAGSRTEVLLHLSSASRLPTSGVLVEDTVPYAAGAKPRFVIDWLTSGTVELRYPLHPMLRGVHPIGPAVVRVSDPFGLAEFSRRLGEPAGLLVVPRTAKLHGMPVGHGSADSSGPRRARAGHGEQDAIVRQYRHGDDLRKVHWRSTAHRDELMVRMEERPSGGGSTVLLDHRAAAHRGHGTGASVEWAISFAASVCLHLHAHGFPVRLVTEDGAELAGQDGAADQGQATLDALAALRPTHRRELAMPGGLAEERAIIAVLGACSRPALGELIASTAGHTSGLAVLLDVGAWSPGDTGEIADVHEGAQLLTAAGWAVVIAGPGDGLADTWQRLCEAAKAATGHLEVQP